MRQISDLRQALHEDAVRLQAGPGLERRILDGAFRPPATRVVPVRPRSWRASSLVAVLATVAILATILYGAYETQQVKVAPGTAPVGAGETTAPIPLTKPIAIDCNSGCNMQPPVFANAKVGWITVQAINGPTDVYRTADGGHSWKPVVGWECSAGNDEPIQASPDGREALVVTSALSPGACDLSIIHTADGGAHWQSFGLPAAVTQCISEAGNCYYAYDQLQFLNVHEGWLFAQGPTRTEARLFRTRDSGAHWNLVARMDLPVELLGAMSNCCQNRSLFTFAPDGALWFVEASPFLALSTTDDGVSWVRHQLPSAGLDTNTLHVLNLRFFGPGKAAMVVTSGARAYVLTLPDAWSAWSSPRQLPVVATTVNGLASALSMIDALNWYAAVGGDLERTADAGYTWTSVGALPAGGCCWVDFADQLHGWSLANQLYATTDGGLHWTVLPPPVLGADFTYPPSS